jgi:hypothetical protein
MFQIIMAMLAAVSAQSCITGKILFNPARVIVSSNPVDVSLYDVQVVSNAPNVELTPNGAVLSASSSVANSSAGYGSMIQTTRSLLYGKVSFMVKASLTPGVVTTVSIASPSGDVMQLDLAGANPNNAYFNMMYQGQEEASKHKYVLNINGGIGAFHLYTFDWGNEILKVSVDGTPQYAVTSKQQTQTDFSKVPTFGPAASFWYVNTTSQIQFSVNDGANVPNDYTRSIAGGPIAWGRAPASSLQSTLQFIDVMCFDYKSQPVQTMPPGINANYSYPAPSSNVLGTQLTCASGNCSTLVMNPLGTSGSNPSDNNVTGTASSNQKSASYKITAAVSFLMMAFMMLI